MLFLWRGELTIWYFIVGIVNPSLHHSGPGLSVLSGAPLVWHRGGLKLHNHLQTQRKTLNFNWQLAFTIATPSPHLVSNSTFGLCMTIVSPDGNSSLRCHWLVETAFLYSAWSNNTPEEGFFTVHWRHIILLKSVQVKLWPTSSLSLNSSE